jgi:hypothetical protein
MPTWFRSRRVVAETKSTKSSGGTPRGPLSPAARPPVLSAQEIIINSKNPEEVAVCPHLRHWLDWLRFSERKGLAMVLLALALLPLATPTTAHTGHLHHYEYVFPDGSINVYDTDDRGALVKHVNVPTSAGVRGAVASAVTGMLYISYGSDRGSGGSMLKYNLMTDRVVWAKKYPFGIDSMSISPDGNTIYMPTGELATGGIWKVIDANSGSVTASIDTGGAGPHNTVVSPDGVRVYLGPRHTNSLLSKTGAEERG